MSKASTYSLGNVYLREIDKERFFSVRKIFTNKDQPVLKYGYWSIRLGDENHRYLRSELNE